MLTYLKRVVEWNSEQRLKRLAGDQGAGFEPRTFTCKSSIHTTGPRVQHEIRKMHEMRCNKAIYIRHPEVSNVCPYMRKISLTSPIVIQVLSKLFTVVIQPLSTRLIKPNFCRNKGSFVPVVGRFE